jgi:hypothetical protein
MAGILPTMNSSLAERISNGHVFDLLRLHDGDDVYTVGLLSPKRDRSGGVHWKHHEV